MYYRDNRSRDQRRSREERGDGRREYRSSRRYDDISKVEDQGRQDRYEKEEKQERTSKKYKTNSAKHGQDCEKKNHHSREKQEKRITYSKEFNEFKKDSSVLASQKDYRTEEASRPFIRKSTNSRFILPETSKRTISKAQLAVRQLSIQLEYSRPKIEFLSLQAYLSMSESEKLKLDKDLREHLDRQIPLGDRIRKEMQENIKGDQNWTANSVSQRRFWTQSPVNPMEREVKGLLKVFLDGSLALRDSYFKMLNNQKRRPQNR